MSLIDSNTDPLKQDQFLLRGLLFNPLNAELNPIRHLLALVVGRHIVHISRIRVNISCDKTPYSVV